MQTEYHVIGTMSGTSLDGLDIALCKFLISEGNWQFSIVEACTYPYPELWKQKLSAAETLSGFDLLNLHNEFGMYTGILVKKFIEKHKPAVDFIASHGHTIFHQPDKGLTLQIGNGAHIAATTGISTICDFRSLDVALEGQGAPLVPIGDKLLFPNYTYCLNLGGFANISFEENGQRLAYDICPVNIVINHLVQDRQLTYDHDGNIARKGIINKTLLHALNDLDFFRIQGPKSLGKEWVIKNVLPLINKFPIQLEDKLRTYYEHIATQIVLAFCKANKKNVLLTGGGTYNKFLIELLEAKTDFQIVIPDKQIIDFKEALIFALLGVLRYRNEPNCLSSVTGAIKDNVGGVIFRT